MNRKILQDLVWDHNRTMIIYILYIYTTALFPSPSSIQLGMYLALASIIKRSLGHLREYLLGVLFVQLRVPLLSDIRMTEDPIAQICLAELYQQISSVDLR
jgi:hypothetical protein